MSTLAERLGVTSENFRLMAPLYTEELYPDLLVDLVVGSCSAWADNYMSNPFVDENGDEIENMSTSYPSIILGIYRLVQYELKNPIDPSSPTNLGALKEIKTNNLVEKYQAAGEAKATYFEQIALQYFDQYRLYP